MEICRNTLTRMQLKRRCSRSRTRWQVILPYGVLYGAKRHSQGCLLRSLHGNGRTHILLHWYLDGLALCMLPLTLFSQKNC